MASNTSHLIDACHRLLLSTYEQTNVYNGSNVSLHVQLCLILFFFIFLNYYITVLGLLKYLLVCMGLKGDSSVAQIKNKKEGKK